MHDLFSHGGGGGNKAPFATSEIRGADQPEAKSKRSKRSKDMHRNPQQPAVERHHKPSS
jgi:hypothetical protein